MIALRKCGATALSVRLCCLPPNATKVQIRYSVQCQNFKLQHRATLDYEARNQCSEPMQFVNVSRFKDIGALTVGLEVEIEHIETAIMSLVSTHDVGVDDVEMVDDSDSDDFEPDGNASDRGLITFERRRGDIMKSLDEVERYRAALGHLVDFATTLRPKPFRESAKIVELRKCARRKYKAHTIEIESDHKEDEVYFDGIIEYIKNNKRRRKGDVVIRCKGAPRSNVVAQRKALDIHTVQSNERNPFLVGQRGLRALIPIPAGTVIGEYFGREFLDNEFDDIYAGTKEWVDINAYAQGTTVQVEIPVSKLPYFANVGDGEGAACGDGSDEVDGKRCDGTKEEEEMMVMEFKIMIDGLNIVCGSFCLQTGAFLHYKSNGSLQC